MRRDNRRMPGAKALSSLAIGFGKLGKGGKLGDGVNPRRTKPDTSTKTQS